MSQEEVVPSLSVENAPLLAQYHAQLNAFKQQREQITNNFNQVTGAIFACENMIAQYEENLKQATENFAKNVEKVVSDVASSI